LFSTPYPANELSKNSTVKNSDIINIHWTSGYQSVENIANLLSLNIPVAFTLHDMNYFTGGCHYSSVCKKYEDNCLGCPQLKNDKYNIPNIVLSEKIKYFSGKDITVISPSKWLADCAKKSTLFKNFRIETIPNSIETELFKNIDKKDAKNDLGINKEIITILFGTENHKEKRKGFVHLLEAMEYCKKDFIFSEYVKNGRILILTFGRASDDLKKLNIPFKSFGYVNDDLTLSKIYSASDFVVLPSEEDNLPNIALEALSCGTPVISFSIGGMTDILKNGENGFLSEPFDIEDMGNNILKFVKDDRLRKKTSDAGRRLIEEKYRAENQVKAYLEIFSDCLKNKKNGKSYDFITKKVLYRSTGDNPRIAPVIQQNFKDIAPWVQAEIRQVETQALYDALKTKNY
ncbi:MAG TPA: glycosyltransferase, partial [Spirochaetota bacterium]|nr:glycosyltransferase [Spirochaetota bacterium]